MASPLILEPIDAPEGLSHRHIEDEVGKGDETNGYPAVAALEARGIDLGRKHQGQEEEEELEQLP